MPLVAGGQEELGLLGHPGHLLALVDRMAHELFGHHVQAGLHRRDGRRSVQEQRQGDNHRLDPVLLGMLDQLLVRAVDFDFLAGFRFTPAVDLRQARPRLASLTAVMVAVEGPPHVVRPDVGDRLNGDVFRVDRPQQHAPLVAGADHAHPHRLGDARAVAEVHRSQPFARGDLRLDGLLEKVAADRLAADGGVEVLAADRLLFGSQIHGAIDEGRMTNDEGNPKSEILNPTSSLGLPPPFGFRISGFYLYRPTSGFTPSGVSSLWMSNHSFLNSIRPPWSPCCRAARLVVRRDHGVGQGDFRTAAGLVMGIGVADAPRPMLQLLGVAAAHRRRRRRSWPKRSAPRWPACRGSGRRRRSTPGRNSATPGRGRKRATLRGPTPSPAWCRRRSRPSRQSRCH